MKYLKIRKHFGGRIARTLMLIGLGLVLVLSAGCDDEDSYEVRLEDARMAIDDGEYAKAKAILLELPQTAEVKEALSNAISGGDLNLDMFNIIITMDELEAEGETGSIDMIGRIIGGSVDTLDAELIAAKLASASEAIELYKDIAEMEGGGIPGLTMDQKLQLGLLCITRTVLTIGKLILDELPADSSIMLTESWIRTNRGAFPVLNPSPADLANIGEDLVFTGYAIDALSATNDMRDDYEEFIGELDTNGDSATTADELNAYIANM